VSDLTTIKHTITAKLAAAESKRQLKQQHMNQRMQEIDSRNVEFQRSAVHLIETIIRPRMAILASHFDNASLLDATSNKHNRCVCTFQRTWQFPASTQLDISVTPDDQIQNIVVGYRLEILPVLVQFDSRGQIEIPMNQVDDQRVASWVDETISNFIDTYLRLEDVESYQAENTVTDPVCGMAINRNSAAAQLEHGGRTYFFCVEDCQRKFAANPTAYAEEK